MFHHLLSLEVLVLVRSLVLLSVLTCGEVTGTIYSVDAAGPAPCAVIAPVLLSIAVGDMETAYTDAAGRPHGVGSNLNLGAGTLANQTLAPGTYTWGSGVTITTDLTFNGGPMMSGSYRYRELSILALI